MPIEWDDIPVVQKKQNYIWPILWLQNEINLSCLKKSINSNEYMKNWTYIRKDKAGKSYTSVFLDGKWVWNTPDKYLEIYDIQWKKHQRAREWEQDRKAPSLVKKEEPPKDSELITYLKDQNIIPDIEHSIVYYVPVEDGKWSVVNYRAMYIKKDNPSEIIQLPIHDTQWKTLRYQTIARSIWLEKPAVDPIDLVCLGWGIWMSFAKWLTTLAPKVGINLSKVAINQMSSGALFLQVLWQELPKEIFQQLAQTGIDFVDEKLKKWNGGI